MKSIKTFLYCSILVLCSSCSKSSVDTHLSSSTKEIQLSSEETIIADTALFKSVGILRLETNPVSLISSIDKIMFDENKYFIFDARQHSVFIFDIDGKFINAIHQVGQGPGEYINLKGATLDITNKRLLLSADRPQKFLYFDYAGNYLSERKNPENSYTQVLCGDKDEIYAMALLSNSSNGYCYLYEIDKGNYEKKCVFDVRNFPESNVYTLGSLITKSPEILFSTRFDNTLYSIKNGTVTAKYRIGFGKYQLPESYKNATVEELDNLARSNQYVFSVVEMTETENYLYFKTNRAGIYVYSKKDNQLKRYSFIFDTKYEFYYSIMRNIENQENFVAFYINDMNDLIRMKGYSKPINASLSKFIDTLHPDDNPILFICEIKN